MRLQYFIVITFACNLSDLTGSFALQCYTCSSDVDKDCPSSSHVKDCDSSYQAKKLKTPNENETTKLDYFCMKQYTYIPDWQVSKVDGIEVQKRMIEPRISRYCAKLPEETSPECHGRNSLSVKTTTCACKSELCNKSPLSVTRNAVESQLLMTFLTSLVAVFILNSK